ncbi:MAG: hypothetical protein R8P61_36595 [Bacteroidia bacterium]|nr:hypothetical protein [Bacteroidia bacterium]
MSIAPEIPESKAWKYAQTEWERSFLLPGPPAELGKLPFKEIEDHYLINTQIRLRRTFDGKNRQWKLSKKLKLQSQSQQWVSTIYLSQREYDLFAQLPAFFLKKRRYYLKDIDSQHIGIDHIVLAEKELWLAEVEFSSEEKLRAYKLPLAFLREVSEETGYNGFELARIFSSLSS